MKSSTIYYFSGTGNTKKVVQMLQNHLIANEISTELICIEKDFDPTEFSGEDSSRLLGIAYPIYSFGTPLNIERFVQRLPIAKGTKVFLLKTGADYISVNHHASANIIRILQEKGYDIFYDRIIVMPSNWLFGYSDGLNQQLVKCANDKTEHMCGELIKGIGRLYSPGPVIRGFAATMANLEGSYGASSFGRSLRVNDKCNKCGLCLKNCPVGNISENTTYYFGENCLFCMRCIYNCPQNAIHSKGYQFCILKKGYNLDKSLKNESDSEKIVTAKTRGYFKHFYKYLIDVSL